MRAPDLSGLVPALFIIAAVIGWGVIELLIWLVSNISITWG